jgi:hypothetical protein
MTKGAPRMSDVERLRQLAANYSRMADLVFREDIRNGLLRLAAETLENGDFDFETDNLFHSLTFGKGASPARQAPRLGRANMRR